MDNGGNRSGGKAARNCCLKAVLYAFVVLSILFVVVFVVVPLIFKYSVGIQRSIVFPTWSVTTKNYTDVQSFGIKGVRNFYYHRTDGATTPTTNVTLGVWQILPDELLSELLTDDDYNYDGILSEGNYSLMVYLHGNGQDRTESVGLYKILRRFFHVFAVDYRGYADSTPRAVLSERDVVEDLVEFCEWLSGGGSGKSRVYVWGHSLGTGVGAGLLARFKRGKGLVLEAPFTSVTDVMLTHPAVKVFSFLPWFRSTLIQPMIDNGLDFDTAENILDVDCPVLILHAKDDDVIPYGNAEELYEIAINNRNSTYQGNVTYRLFEELGYGHMDIYRAPELPNLIEEFKEDCERFEKKKLNFL